MGMGSGYQTNVDRPLQVIDGFRGRPIEPPESVRLPTGASVTIQKLNRAIRQVAKYDSNVLIHGGTGTGKEIVARAIHDLSSRRLANFVPINCGAIPTELLESELFGHVRGAFSGAFAARVGRFELAHGGTIFLDEIGELSPGMQVKLLRVLQEQTFERVGSSCPTRCDVRVIAATHRNLQERIAAGVFREDLFHRLNVCEIELPPLCKRIEDLELAGQRTRTRKSHGTPVRDVRQPAGSVADLPPAIQASAPDTAQGRQMGVVAPPATDGAVASNAFVPAARETAVLPVDGMDLRSHISALERAYLEQAMHRSGQVLSRAAVMLGLKRTTLADKLRRHGMAAGLE